MFSSRDLYRRGMATLVASWEAYAGGSEGAAVIRSPGLAAAVFPSEPARAVYNNALLARDLGPAEREAAPDAAEATYGSAGYSPHPRREPKGGEHAVGGASTEVPLLARVSVGWMTSLGRS